MRSVASVLRQVEVHVPPTQEQIERQVRREAVLADDDEAQTLVPGRRRPTVLDSKDGNELLGHIKVEIEANPDLDDDTRWTARQLPGGLIEWTSPLGRTYTDRPPARIMFT